MSTHEARNAAALDAHRAATAAARERFAPLGGALAQFVDVDFPKLREQYEAAAVG